MTERWIYGYRSTGVRALTEDERRKLKRKMLAWVWTVVPSSVVTATATLAIVALISALAGGEAIEALICALIFAVSVVVLVVAARMHKRLRLARLALLRGQVESFEYVGPDEAVRAAHVRGPRADPDDPDLVESSKPFWEREADLLDALQRTSRRVAPSFEIVAGEEAILNVDGRRVNGTINVQVVTVTRA